MIKSFRNEVARAAWARRFVKGVPHDVLRIGNRKLLQLQNARSLQDLRAPPGNRLEALAGDRRGQHSIRINDQWRICFVWDGDGARDVEIVEYHA
jgi:proteic killer suppression protein